MTVNPHTIFLVDTPNIKVMWVGQSLVKPKLGILYKNLTRQ